MKKTVAGLLLSMACVAPALAADSGAYVAADFGPATYTNATGFPNPGVLRIAGGLNVNRNFGVELGYSIFGNSSISGLGAGSASFSKTDLAYGVGAKFNITPQFGIEGQYFNYGAFDSTTVPLKASSLTVGAVFNF